MKGKFIFNNIIDLNYKSIDMIKDLMFKIE